MRKHRSCLEKEIMQGTMPGEEDHARPGWTTSRRGQDSPWRSQSEWQRTGINGESMSMMWSTVGSRTAEEQNRIWYTPQCLSPEPSPALQVSSLVQVAYLSGCGVSWRPEHSPAQPLLHDCDWAAACPQCLSTPRQTVTLNYTHAHTPVRPTQPPILSRGQLTHLST